MGWLAKHGQRIVTPVPRQPSLPTSTHGGLWSAARGRQCTGGRAGAYGKAGVLLLHDPRSAKTCASWVVDWAVLVCVCVCVCVRVCVSILYVSVC